MSDYFVNAQMGRIGKWVGPVTQYTVKVTWGERVALAVSRWETTNRRRTWLFQTVAAATNDASPNTIAKLLQAPERPQRPKDRWRAIVLLLALGEDLKAYGLDVDELPTNWSLTKIRATLKPLKYAPRDSNPEPADFDLVGAAA